MQQEVKSSKKEQSISDGTYEIIQNRLQKQKSDLQERLHKLNESRKEVFGSLETKLLTSNRISTENNCIAGDIVSFGTTCLFGYNVHFGLRTDITLSDVFSVYKFSENSFEPKSLSLLDDEVFRQDFSNLYKYYRNTVFSKFSVIGNYLYMVFQLSESPSDIKTFKWLIKEDSIQYIDNRSDHEYKFPVQHEFKWQEVTREMHRYGVHSHISILDTVFVETIGGDLTIKIEDNTEDGKGIFSEPVEEEDQTLDDGQFRFADLGNIIILEIKPFQETARYFAYNHKVQEVNKIDSIKDCCVLLPDDQGIIFPNGYYLQTGNYHLFEISIPNVKFEQKIASPNGEDFLYVFFSPKEGLYNLMSYNIISQEIRTPIICSGFTVLPDGELCYFRKEEEQTKHHTIQIWQTPFLKSEYIPSQHTDSLLYKIGNKDVVKAMAEINGLITLLNKPDNYEGIYGDIAKFSKDILDAYYWFPEAETQQLDKPLKEINKTANAAIDEFQKVVQLKKRAAQQTQETKEKAEALFSKLRTTGFKKINDFVQVLTQLRELRGEVISLNEIRYVQKDFIENLEVEIGERTKKISGKCVLFLLDKEALKPYQDSVQKKSNALEKVAKVIETRKLEDEVNGIASDLELLIEIVSNLDIEDTSHSTKIIDNISLIFATINQLKASIKNKKKSLGSVEAQADFAAQLKLIDQSIINYIDIANTPEKCDEFLTRISIQLEELEGKFAEFDDFIKLIIEKREEVYAAFEGRKNSLVEKRNKRALSLLNAGKRILKGAEKRAESFSNSAEINGYFASDLMINKVRDIVQQLKEMDDVGKAEEIETILKTTRENAIRKLKDKQELYEDGDTIIRLGNHRFGVNKQPLDLTITLKDGKLVSHLTGTDFYQELDDEILLNSRHIWNQELVSENEKVYRSAYLAFKIFNSFPKKTLQDATEGELYKIIQEESRSNYSEGYIKGVHDVDAAKILFVLAQKHHELGLLSYSPQQRAFAQYFWHSLSEEKRDELDQAIKASGEVLSVFPNTLEYDFIIKKLINSISAFAKETELFSEEESPTIADYIFKDLQSDSEFVGSNRALEIKDDFLKTLKEKKVDIKFTTSYKALPKLETRIRLIRQWVSAFINTHSESSESRDFNLRYVDEVVCNILFDDQSVSKVKAILPTEKIDGISGSHPTIQNGEFKFNYHDFISLLTDFSEHKVPEYLAFQEAKRKVINKLKTALRLEEFRPNVLTSFIRNKLIDQVYFPLIGDNLAKQLGTVGDNKRTDRMGMLLLISPPGYGKTTLLEYVANRLGLIFVKINGPAIGHEITSVDPLSANNSAAREELKKLNLALEMGNNVMLYLDDIQHCNPEFLQKFISLSDGTRKIEGIYEGQPKTYDLSGKKFCLVMAGNPYTESGEKFHIPDMLANRADIYNLGDIIGETEHLFKLSLIENSLTSNPILQQLSTKNFEDVYRLIDRLEGDSSELQLQGNHSPQELQEYLNVLQKVIKVRDILLKVNAAYIKSAAMDDAYRTEPAFKLQGSYRDMNKLVGKIEPVMNERELQTLLLSHYESESQTLTSAAEANLLKYQELIGKMDTVKEQRWTDIKETFVKNNKLKGFGDKNELAQVLSQMMDFTENLAGIKKALERGLSKN